MKAGAIAARHRPRRRTADAPSDTGCEEGADARTTCRRCSRRWSTSAPAGDDWLHEIKYDGYRMVCASSAGKARLFSRNGKDWTSTFPAVARDLAELPVKSAWIDGEVVVLDADGRTSFQALQNALDSTTDARPAVLRVRSHLPRRLRPARRGADRTQARCCATSSATAQGPRARRARSAGQRRRVLRAGLHARARRRRSAKRAESHYRDGIAVRGTG